jgi:hypothetical protein
MATSFCLSLGLSFLCEAGRSVAYNGCADKKEDKSFHVNKEIQKGLVAKSYVTNGLLYG